MHDDVLVVGDRDGGVLVRDAGEQRVGAFVGVGEECASESGDGSGEGPALFPVGLVSPVEQAVEEFGRSENIVE